jgi:CRP-like cAMP-binding protein
LFRDLVPETIELLAATARRQHHDRGERLVTEGQKGDSLFIVFRGSVNVVTDDPESRSRITLASLGPGSFFGEMSLLTGDPRSATVEATEACEVFVLSRDDVQPVMSSDPNMAWSLSRSLAARAADLAEKVRDHQKTAGEKSGAFSEASLLTKIRSFFSLK